MKRLLLYLAVFTLPLTDCTEFEEQKRLSQNDETTTSITETTPQTRAGTTPVFEQEENPYTLARMRRLKGNNNLQPTHYYGRFLPADSAQLNKLENTPDLDLFDFPLDVNIEDGEEYVDPTIPEGEFTWQYTVIPANFTRPSGITWQKLTDVYIPADGEEVPIATRAGESDLEIAAILDAGYDVPVETRANGDKKPDGIVEVFDNSEGVNEYVPVKGVRVKCHYFMKIDNDYTDGNGRYSMGKKFHVKPNYVVVFKNTKGFILWDFLGVRAKYRVKNRQAADGYDIRINEDSWRDNWERAVINNAAYEYYEMCEQTGICKPPFDLKIWVRPSGDMSSAPMIRRIAGTQYITRSGWASFFGPLVLPLDSILKIFEPDILIGTDNSDYRGIYESVNHELSHASHFMQVGSTYWAKYVSYIIDNGSYGSGGGPYGGICGVGEMWGYAMEHIQGAQAYDDIDKLNNHWIYIAIDGWIEPDPIWALITRGVLTKKQVFDSMTYDVDTVDKWINKLISLYPSQADAIQAAFIYNDVPTITGNNPSSVNISTTYTIPDDANLSDDFTFTGWTITPPMGGLPGNGYIASGGLNSRNLTVRFMSYGKYTLSANFTLPGGTTYTATKTIEPAPPSDYYRPPTITSDVTSTTMGGRVAFSVQGANPQSGITYDWMINGVINGVTSPTMVTWATDGGFSVQCRTRYSSTTVSQWSNTVIITVGSGNSTLPTPQINAIESYAPSGQKIYQIYTNLNVPQYDQTLYYWEWEIRDGVNSYGYGDLLASWTERYQTTPNITFDTYFDGPPRTFVVRCRVSNPPSAVSDWAEVRIDGVTKVIYYPSGSVQTNSLSAQNEEPNPNQRRFEVDGGWIVVE
jgi:hypothetical protein